MGRVRTRCVLVMLFCLGASVRAAEEGADGWPAAKELSWEYYSFLESYPDASDDHLSAILKELSLDDLHALFLEALREDLSGSYRCQTFLIDSVVKRKDDYLATLKAVVKVEGAFGGLLDRLLYEGSRHLDALSFFDVLAAAKKAGQWGTVIKLQKILLDGAKERPKELATAVGLALKNDDTNLVFGLWNQASEGQRTDELFKQILDGAMLRGNQSLARAFIEAFTEYEGSHVISEANKRFATGVALAEKISKDLWESYVALLILGDGEPDLDAEEEWRSDVEKELKAFLGDALNPYYKQDQMRLLARHLDAWMGKQKPGAKITGSHIKAECDAWSLRHRAYGIPLVMKTRIY